MPNTQIAQRTRILAAVALTALVPTGAMAAMNSTAKATLTFDYSYTEQASEDVEGGAGSHSTGKETLNASGSVSYGVEIMTYERGGFEILDIPKPTAAEKAHGNASVTYSGALTQTQTNDPDYSEKYNQTIKGTEQITIPVAEMNEFGNGWRVDVNLSVKAAPKCDHVRNWTETTFHPDIMHPEQTRRTKSDDACAGGIFADGLESDGYSKGLRVWQKSAVDADTQVEPGRDWVGGTLTGNIHSGLRYVFDGTRKLGGKENGPEDKGVKEGTEHLHIVATLVPLARQCRIDDQDIQLAFKKLMAKKGVRLPSLFMMNKPLHSGLPAYQVRLTQDNAILPTWKGAELIVADGGRPQPGARHWLVGSVQVSGEDVRVVARIFDGETAVILTTGQGTGHGCEQGLDTAMAQAFATLNPALKSYRPY